MGSRPNHAALILTTILAVAVCVPATARAQQAATASQSAATPAQKLELAGVPNSAQVNATLYRGGQPEKEGYAALKRLGIEIVVSFRDEKDKIEAERRIVESLGMLYVSVPWRSSRDPESREVAAFFQVLRDFAGRKVFAHCRRGADRTGVMIATYRIAFENWTPEQALREMEEFRFRGFWLPHLKEYIRNFPQELASHPELRALQPARAH